MDRIINIKRHKTNLFKDLWVWKIAWKDARKNLLRLLLFVATIVTGIATLVAVSSFNYNLRNDIDEQAKALLGADLVLYNDNAFSADEGLHFDSLENRQAQDARFASMVLFPGNKSSRLAQVVALQGPYPFYGGMETMPEQAMEQFREGKGALLDENMAWEFDIFPGDSVKIGKLQLPVLGLVTKIPGNVKIVGTMAPSAYISYDSLKATGLLKKGSRVNYRKYLKTTEGQTPEELLANLKPVINRFGLGYETVAYRKKSLGSSFDNLYRFLNLLGYIALLLGSIGVASSVHIYTKEKRNTVAILRCIGVPGNAPFLIFFLQISVLGILGSLAGVVLGSLVQMLIPLALKDFLPVPLDFSVSWAAVAEGMVVGLVITVLFSLLPLLHIRHVPPVAVLQTRMPNYKSNIWPKALVALLILLFNWALAVWQTRDLLLGSLFFGAFVLAILVFLLTASLVRMAIKHASLHSFGFIWRQSLANLFRPNNQTLVLMVVIGFGTFLISTVSIVENGILEQVSGIGKKTRANLVLFDIQPDQKAEAEQLTASHEVELEELIPVLMVRLSRLRSLSLEEVQQDTTGPVANWLLYMEHLVTYRDHLLDSEKLVAGDLRPLQAKSDSVYISVTETMAEQLHLKLHDQVMFNLHGISITTYVGSIRKVDWQQIQTNFAFVFPKGVLEQAPQFYAMLLYANSKWQAAGLKQELMEKMPNVSTVDLSLIMKTLDGVIGRLAFAIRFMAMFSILTGLLVLAGSVINSKFAKIRENTLLRTLGALKKQIVRISLLEYSYLGSLAALIGLLLSILASWGLSAYFLDLAFTPDPYRMTEIFLLIVVLTVGISWLNLRSIVNHSPLDVLRKDGQS